MAVGPVHQILPQTDFQVLFIVESLYWQIGLYLSLLIFSNYFHEVARRFSREAYYDSLTAPSLSYTLWQNKCFTRQIRWKREEKWVEHTTIMIKTFQDTCNFKIRFSYGSVLQPSFVPGTHSFVSLVHSQGRARKAERVGGPDELGELVWDSRVPCEGV